MKYPFVGAGSLRSLNSQSVYRLLIDDIKPALATQKQTTLWNVENAFTPNATRAGFKSTADHSINDFCL
jgi:hypothetical protein